MPIITCRFLCSDRVFEGKGGGDLGDLGGDLGVAPGEAPGGKHTNCRFIPRFEEELEFQS